MRLYISGIKNPTQARSAVSLGACALGIKLGYGKDDVHPEIARDIFFSLPLFISRVGIFADEKRYSVQELVTFCRLDTLHFMGNEEPEEIERYPERVMKTFHPQNMKRIRDYSVHGVVIHMDAEADREMAPELFESRSLILGGLNTLTEWVDAVKKYRPHAVQLDISYCTAEMTGHLLCV